MPTILKPSYPSLDAIPEAQRDFYILNTADNVYELAQEGTTLADHYNRQIARKRDEFRDEKDRQKREAERLEKENRRLTESNDRLRRTRDEDVARLTQQVEKAETDLRRATTDDGVVISKTDAALFDRLKKLGKPEDVTANKLDAIVTHVETTVRDAEILRTENEQHKLDDKTREISDIAGYSYDALRDVLRHPDYGKDIVLVVENVKDPDDKTKLVPTAFVTYKKDGKDEKQEIGEYAAEHWKTFLPALTAESDDGEQPERGTRLVKQKPARDRTGDDGKGSGNKKIDEIINRQQAERDKAPNPLAPPKPAATT